MRKHDVYTFDVVVIHFCHTSLCIEELTQAALVLFHSIFCINKNN